MKIVLNDRSALLVIMGTIWFLQGINVLPGSFMTGQIRWAVRGGIAALAGIVTLLWTNRILHRLWKDNDPRPTWTNNGSPYCTRYIFGGRLDLARPEGICHDISAFTAFPAKGRTCYLRRRPGGASNIRMAPHALRYSPALCNDQKVGGNGTSCISHPANR